MTSKGKTLAEVAKLMQDISTKDIDSPPILNSSVVKLKSNQYKSKRVSIGDGIDLVFDSSGNATIPKYQMHCLVPFMQSKPGRIRIVDENTPAASEPSTIEESIVEEEVLVTFDEENKTADVETLVQEITNASSTKKSNRGRKPKNTPKDLE